MSWNSSYPPPRRSRSRSPGRGSYPPRDAPYPPDQYRDWEAYDRERAWASYDRDRGAYDYPRGRSRSPPPQLNRKRPRSNSPYDRERYDPRPRYDDYGLACRVGGVDGCTDSDLQMGTGPTGTRHRPVAAIRRVTHLPGAPRRIPTPSTIPRPSNSTPSGSAITTPSRLLRRTTRTRPQSKRPATAPNLATASKASGKSTKKDFAAGQLQTMFDHHRKSPWFSEKYDPAPEFDSLRKRVRKEGWKDRFNTFLLDLDSGKFDPDLTPEPDAGDAEPSSPAKENGASAANGEAAASDSAIANPNGAAAPISEAEPKASGDDDEMQFNMNVEEDLPADADANRADANGKGASGGGNSGNRRASDRGDEVSVMPEGNQVMIRTIPPDIGRVKLEDACSKVPGFIYIALGDPLQKRNYYRAGWLRFRDDADMSAVLTELSEKKIEGFKLHVTHNVKPFTNRVRYAPEVSSRPDRMEKDLANAKALAAKLEGEAAELRKLKIAHGKAVPAEGGEAVDGEDVSMPVAAEEDAEEEEPEPRERGCDAVERRIEKVMADLRAQELIDVNDDKAYEAKKTAVSLDLYLAYLRAAFHTCYYCAIVTDHLEELQRKCLKHERKPLSKMLLEELKAAEIALLINREGVDPRDYGGKSYDEELTKAVEPYLKQEDEGKFRCKTCQKLFKATTFVEKHIANKHPELVKSLDEIPYFNNFALDPHRIQPFTHPPAATGNGQLPPPQAYGMQAPSHHRDGDNYGRGQHGGGGSYGQSSGYPPSGYGGSQWDHHGRDGYPPGYHQGRGGRDDGTNGRRLSDRLGGFADGLPAAGAGLPAKPTAATMDGALVSGSGGGGGNQRGRGGGRGGGGGPLPPPPPDAKEDPRASAGKRVSYHDMDQVADGDVELFY
ncbi:hypothetical protein MVEN_02422000 [Mycena venus]|uniref:C2H2-type domain-containing protein n=1 Tax=Mycena venus TaxID=2733690 RepID=A0A8H6WY45_9AGAR|nr:hypothetical protein MVEN_02422000 [Mycena venus]